MEELEPELPAVLLLALVLDEPPLPAAALVLLLAALPPPLPLPPAAASVAVFAALLVLAALLGGRGGVDSVLGVAVAAEVALPLSRGLLVLELGADGAVSGAHADASTTSKLTNR